MEIAVQRVIAAPPAVVFRFYTRLDHLRFISPRGRAEWCPALGTVMGPGVEAEVRLKQGGHELTLRFRNIAFEQDRVLEDEFLSWPLRGGRHRYQFEASARGTELCSTSRWEPPWYLRKLAERHAPQQRRFFEERQENAQRLIEAVFQAKGDGAFSDGIAADALSVGLSPFVRP